MYRVMLVVLAVSVVGLAGCGRGEITLDRGSGTVSVTLSESDVNAAIEAALEAQDNPLLRDPSVDLQNGTIVISGQHLRRDGSGETVSGSVSLVPAVSNNRLSISVTAVDIEGVAMDDADAQAFADRVAERINAALGRTVRVFEVTSINVSDTGLEFVLARSE